MDINSVVIIGRLVANATVKQVNQTNSISFTLAVDDTYQKDKPQTSFVDITYWSKNAQIAQYLTKGKQICVYGRLKQDKWEKDGQKYSKLYVIANQVQLLSHNSNGNQNNGNNQQANNQYNGNNANNGNYQQQDNGNYWQPQNNYNNGQSFIDNGSQPYNINDYQEDIPF